MPGEASRAGDIAPILGDFAQMWPTLHSYYGADGNLHEFHADLSQSTASPTLDPPDTTHASHFFSLIALGDPEFMLIVPHFSDTRSGWGGYVSPHLSLGCLPGHPDTKDGGMYACMHVCMCAYDM